MAGLEGVGGASILIVDDNPINLKLARVMLRSEGYDVHVAADAEEALRLLDRVHPRLILMDLNLPGMGGLELTRHLKANQASSDIVILALTAYAMPGDEQEAFAAGCDGFIAKPVDTRTFPRIVARHLEAR